ncbi:MAG: acyl-CoA thioesterase [Caulobacteraceae bacterium]|nr:acyl-CoA thioesterase [Caulobacteraceae bacterium]
MSRLFEPPEGRRVFRRDFVPQASDIDANGHVNNVVYLAWAQTLAIDHWDSAASAEESERWAWVALRHEVDYRRALMPGETGHGRTWVSDVAEGPRFDRFVRIDGPDGVMCAQVRTVWCLIDRATGRPRRVPADLLARFG